MYERILVPLIGSRAAEAALPYAEEIGSKLDAEIILVSVFDPRVGDATHLYRTYLEHITEQVSHRMARRRADRRARVLTEVLAGKPASEILRYADSNKVNLIIMLSRGSSGQSPWMLSDIADKVLRTAQIPVLLIRARDEEMTLRRRRLVKSILVPLDGSAAGKSAFLHAETLARALGANLVLLQVLEPLTGWAGAISSTPPDSALASKGKRHSLALSYLNSLGEPLKASGLKVTCAVGYGTPAEQIISYAKAKSIDLIAMSTHGRSGIGRWAFGSVTDKVLHAGDASVLVVRASRTA